MGRCKKNNLERDKNMGWGELMKYTPNLNLKKPDLTENVNIQDLNDNMDVLDTAVSELREGATSIPDLETNDKTLAGAINELKGEVTNVETNAKEYTDQYAAAIDTRLDNHIKNDVGHVWWVGAEVGTNPNNKRVNSSLIVMDTSTGKMKPKQGVAFRFFCSTTNTSNIVTLSTGNGAGNYSDYYDVLTSDGSRPTIGSLVGGAIYTVAFNGSSFFLQGSGSGVTTRGSQAFTTPGTYAFTVPKGVSRITMYAFGAGGGGGGCFIADYSGGGGGGGGAFLLATVPVTPGQVLNVAVGAGGVGAAPGANYGSTGGMSGLTVDGTSYYAGGGGGGGYGGPAASDPNGLATPGRGGGGGRYNENGPAGEVTTTEGIEGRLHPFNSAKTGILIHAFTGGGGGWSNYGYYGGGGGGGASDMSGGAAAKGYSLGSAGNVFSNFVGSPGAGPTYKSAGNDATGYGGGGSGSCLPSGRGGNGAPGRVYLYW